jgi:hypothetical protein
VVAADAVRGAEGELERLKLPVLLLGDGAIDRETIGPRVVSLHAEATPEAILDVVRDLGR